jgi:hypothetical protein
MIATVQPPSYGMVMAGTLLSIMMLAGVLMTGGGIFAIAKSGDRKRGILMILVGLVLFVNVLIAGIPLD